MSLGDKLKQFRKDNAMTQQELADSLFVSRSLVAKWEQGRGVPTVDVLEKLATLMNTTLEDLIGEKEMLTCTIESNVAIKSHRRITIIFTIVASALLLTIVGLIVGFYLFKNEKGLEEKPRPIYETALFEFYTFAKRVDNKLIIEYDGVVEFAQELDVTGSQGVIVTDKYNRKISLNDVQNGFKLRVTFSYLQDKSGYGFPAKFYDISQLDVIEDYVDGQEYAQGFFLSTVLYTGENVPINSPELGFVNNRQEIDQNGNPVSLYEKYPYYLVRSFFTGFGLLAYNDGVEYRQVISGDVILRQRTFDVRVTRQVEKIYVYAVKNGNNGYYLHDTLTKENPSTILTTKYITDEYKNDNKRSHATVMEMNITANFVSIPKEILEFNKNHVLIKTTPFGKSYMHILDDDTRYLQLKCDDGSFTTTYAPGESILTVRVLSSGFVEDFYLTTY